MELSVYIGNKIKYYREQMGMTQEDLAKKLKTTRQPISRYENGDRKANQDILFELADIFGISINTFFPRVETKDINEKLFYIYQVISNYLKPYQISNLYGFVCYRIYQIISTIYQIMPLFCHLKSHTHNRARQLQILIYVSSYYSINFFSKKINIFVIIY